MLKTIRKDLVVPGILFIIMILAVISFIARFLVEQSFLILVMTAFSMSGIYFRSVWKWEEESLSNRKIGKICFYLSSFAVTVCLILLILSFLGIHIIIQTSK